MNNQEQITQAQRNIVKLIWVANIIMGYTIIFLMAVCWG